MIRDLPPDADIYAEASPHSLLAFARVAHPRLSASLHVVSDVLPYDWNGARWEAVPFEFRMVTDDDSDPYTQVAIQNVDRRIGEALRAITERASISVWVLTSADFDLTQNPRVPFGTVTPLYQFLDYDLVDVSIDALRVTGRVMLRGTSQEPYPGIRATQSRFPGLFL